MNWNESGFRPLLCTYRLNWVARTPWGLWDEWDDTALQTKFEIQTLEVWGRARYLSVTEAPHITAFYEWMGKTHHYPRATAQHGMKLQHTCSWWHDSTPHRYCRNIPGMNIYILHFILCFWTITILLSSTYLTCGSIEMTKTEIPLYNYMYISLNIIIIIAGFISSVMHL